MQATDLEKTDGSDRVLASDVAVTLDAATLAANDQVDAVIEIVAERLSSSGEYSGAVVVRADGDQQVIPLTIRVKDPLFWPWVTVILGVALGSGLSWYRANGLPRDEIVVQAGRVRSQLQRDPDLSQDVAQRFRLQIESELVAVDTALEASDWAAASTAIAAARQVWTRWRQGRADWIKLLTYRQQLVEQVAQSAAASFPYGQTIEAGLSAVERQAATDFDTPSQLAERLHELRQWLSDYRGAEALLDELYSQVRQLSKDGQSVWRSRQDVLEQQLQALRPDEPKFTETLTAWRQSVEAEIQAVVAEQGVGRRETLARGSGERLPQATSLVPTVPGGVGRSRDDMGQSQRRLRLFNWVGRGVAIAMLSWAGMVELYEGNPTFGATPMGDYFVLLAWGFGAEVTRESVVKAIQDLTTPLKKKA